MDWKAYWEQNATRFDRQAFHAQVGRTYDGGKPTPEPELQIAVAEARARLALRPTDHLLDLCCGNGLLTHRFAANVALVTGVDFAPAMIDIARAHHGADNVHYVEGSVDALPATVAEIGAPYTRVCLLESLHYFGPASVRTIFQELRRVCATRHRVLLSGVTDVERKWSFFDTPERKARYLRMQADGTDVMGRWWHRDELQRIADDLDYELVIEPQDERLNTAHYRFDAVFSRG